jgi:serine/threonine-protein kinase ULK/ATG1
MEFCELGDLSLFIKKRSSLSEHEATKDMIRKYPLPAVGGLNEVVVRHFLQQIASALEFMREKALLHRDIKPQNLLLVPSRRWYEKNRGERTPVMIDDQSEIPARGIESLPMLKIADFGFARFLPSLELAETLCGSPLYMAPEILRYEKYDAKADLWSVGTVLHEMMVGKPPFRASNHVELLRKIEKNDDRIKFPEGLAISDGMKRLIRSLLKRNPTERVSYEVFFTDEVIKSDIPGLVGDDRPREPLAQNLASRISRTRPSDTFSSSPKGKHLDAEVSPHTEVPPGSSTARTSRPSSRTESYHTPPKGNFIDDRPSTEGQYSAPHERRPTLTSAATAPGKPQEKTISAAAATMERRNSRATPPVGTSMLKEHLEREPRRIPNEKTQREARERAAQDIAFERDYVLVEKRQVEVNAFADELALSPQVGNTQGAMVRRATTSTTPLSSTAPASNQIRQGAMQIVGRQGPMHQRAGSYERRYGRSPTSATSAISKALNMANFRLFGMGFSPPSGKGPSPPPQGYAPFPTYPTEQSSMLMIGDGGRTMDSRDEDTRIASQIEDLAHRSDVVWGFADIKYQQLLPSRPVSSHGLGLAEGRKGRQFPEAVEVEEPDLPVEQILIIAEEALVLFVKVLAILKRVMDVSASWFHHSRAEIAVDSPRSAPTRTNSATATAPRINSVVQWARNRFNDALEKSEFVSRKLVDAQKQLPLDHPGHPNNHPCSSMYSAGSVGTSTEQVLLTSGITAEKLMYDRALEMSRTAAVNELTQEDFEGGVLSYRTAIYMLEAILDNDDDRSFRRKSMSKKDEKPEDELINGLESEDRATLKKRKYLVLVLAKCDANVA